MGDTRDVPVGKLIMVPALITLGISILRLVGELQGWSKTLFNRAAGGGGALVGIAWLPFVFGAYFAWRLIQSGRHPQSAKKALLVNLGAIVAFAATMVVGRLAVGASPVGGLAFMVTGSAIGLFVASRAWPGLFKTLLAYAFAARIPVIVIMFLAMTGSWGTHYDALPSEPEAVAVLQPMSPFLRWFWIGLLPQMAFWVFFTVVIGGLVGAITVLVAGKKVPEHRLA
jgi:hypothetical protein